MVKLKTSNLGYPAERISFKYYFWLFWPIIATEKHHWRRPCQQGFATQGKYFNQRVGEPSQTQNSMVAANTLAKHHHQYPPTMLSIHRYKPEWCVHPHCCIRNTHTTAPLDKCAHHESDTANVTDNHCSNNKHTPGPSLIEASRVRGLGSDFGPKNFTDNVKFDANRNVCNAMYAMSTHWNLGKFNAC